MHDLDPRLALLREVQEGVRTPESALAALRAETDLGHAVIDDERERRTGLPEVVFGLGKTPAQVAPIVAHLIARGQPALVTRASAAHFEATAALVPGAVFEADAGLLWAAPEGVDPFAVRVEGEVLVVAAGTSDLPVATEALRCARFMGLDARLVADVGVAGLHRLLSRLDALRTAKVVITVAGMEGALPSVVGGLVRAPVIAVPTSVGYGAQFQGLAPLLSALNACSGGIGVVNIDNGFGAAQLAHRILTGAR